MSNTSSAIFHFFKDIGLLRKPFYAQEIMTPWGQAVKADRDHLGPDFLRSIKTMTQHDVHQIFVVDNTDKPLGYVSLDKLIDFEKRKDSGEKVSTSSDSLMKILTVNPQETIFHVVNKMKQSRSDAVVVVAKDGSPMGIITPSDIQTKI